MTSHLSPTLAQLAILIYYPTHSVIGHLEAKSCFWQTPDNPNSSSVCRFQFSVKILTRFCLISPNPEQKSWSCYVLTLLTTSWCSSLLCDEENGDWDQMANYPPHIPTCLHRHVSSEKLTGHRSIIWMHADAESGLPIKIVVVLMLGSNSHWGRPQREKAWRRIWEKPSDEKKEWRSSEFCLSHFSAGTLWS